MGVFALGLMSQTTEADDGRPKRKLRHIVCFRFKEDATQMKIDSVVREFAAMEKKIPQIRDFEMGTNNSPENLNNGFTHCFVVTFWGGKGRETYLPHPAHNIFVVILKPILGEVFEFDFWSD